MAWRSRVLVVVVLSLELLGAHAARAGARGDATLDGRERRAEPIRFDLTWAWPQQPPPLIPPAGSAAPPSGPAPAAAPGPHAGGAQVAMAIVMTLVGDISGILAATGTDKLWAGAIPWALAPFGAAAVVCKAGMAVPGRCRATLAGALIGAAVGLLPGMLILVRAGSEPELEAARDMYRENRLMGFEFAFILYGVGVPVGTTLGYNLGGAAQPNQISPPVAIAPIFTLRF